MADKMTTLEKFQANMPGREDFYFSMNANSTVEVGVEIDTGLTAGQGWQIYGIDWGIYDEATPFEARYRGAAALNSLMLQLQRGELPTTPVLLSPHSPLLMMQDIITTSFATAVGWAFENWPRKFRQAAVTTQQKLNVTFGTLADDVSISDATYQIRGSILYDLVDAPDVGQGKGGNLADL